MMMSKNFARVAGRSAVRAAKPSRGVVSVQAFKVTLKTPSGDKTIEVSPDTYILDAAEVRVGSKVVQHRVEQCARSTNVLQSYWAAQLIA
jgi:hypothetical protein